MTYAESSMVRTSEDHDGHAAGAGEIPGLHEVDAASRAGIRVLVVDDDRVLRESCARFLESENYRVTLCRRGDEARDLLGRQAFDIVLLDLYMSGVAGTDLLKVALKRSPETIVIVMTGQPSIDSSVEVLRAGAWDYLPKPFSATHLQLLIGRAAHTVIVGRETRDLRAEVERQHGNSEKVNVLGTSPAFRRVIDLARKVARTDASVFLTGESGTGKELIAQFIHSHSRRDSRPLIAVNCAAIPETLLETEMFGHRKGAFTGAVEEKRGLLEAANGGTLFLDELTQMPTAIQAKLLRVIQDGVVRRVGSDTVNAVVNVRFIAATNVAPEEAIREGELREDLYYRLRVVPINVPPLRERRDDIPLLANAFLRLYWSRHRDPGTPVPSFSDGAVAALCTHPWRGNVRELQNVVEHGVVLFEPGGAIQPSDIPFSAVASGSTRVTAVDDLDPIPAERVEQGFHAARQQLLARFEQRYLTSLLSRAGGNMSRAARIAGVDRTTLYRLMEKHGLQRETIMVSSD